MCLLRCGAAAAQRSLGLWIHPASAWDWPNPQGCLGDQIWHIRARELTRKLASICICIASRQS